MIKSKNMDIEVIKGDITQIEIEAIVNAANSTLLGGGGVDGAIHRKGGKAILEECIQIRNRQGGCAVGEAVITTAGELPAHYVIHTVGPVWHGGSNNEAIKLRNCYLSSLRLAAKHNIRSVAFPNISTGVYRFPKARAAKIAVEAVREYRSENTIVEKVVFVCFDEENYGLYRDLLP
ncbi:MAG: O-acetyl-ADP-ribose deacetylase [Saprospiraceae bacterium]